VRSERPVTVAVGRFGSVIDRGLREVLGGARGLRLLGAGLDDDALHDAVARRGAQVVILDEDSAATSSLPRRLCGATSRRARIAGGSHLPHLPEGPNHLDHPHHPDVGLVVLAHRPTRAYAARALAFGVTVCLSTDVSAAEIVRGVRLAAEGRQALISMSERPSRVAQAIGRSALTRRERQVLNMLGKGHRNADIARTLQISVETVRMHAKHVYRKLGVSSRGELLGVEI